MTAQQLKNSILQMAVQGKLVPQDPNDEPASVLLGRIKAEKEELIKAGKIKKDKKSSEIFRGSSRNLPYAFCEQIGNEIRDISDEIPFDIPDSWEWVRFSNLVDFSMGKTPPRKETEYWENPRYPWISIADMPADGTVISTKEKVSQYAADNTFKSGISPIGTLIMSFKLTVGKVSILGIDSYHNEAIISIFPYIDDEKIVTSYLFKILPLIAQNGDTKTAIKGATLNSDSLSNLLIPLPSISEQKRIVSKITELEPCITSYGIAETRLSELNSTFPEALKKSILQEAVQGKLVPQNPDDEPASVLLERIRAEKQELIKTGKIKKDKHDSVIVTRDKIPYEIIDGKERCIADEVPFEIPDGWCWSYLGTILSKLTDGSHNPPPNSGTGYPVISAKNIKNGKITFDNVDRFTDEAGFVKENARTNIQENDVLMGIIGGSIGNIAVYNHSDKVIAQRSIAILRFMIDIDYGIAVLKSPLVQNKLQLEASGSAQGGVYLGTLSKILIPVPPLSEQKRIVAKIEELMQYCEKL